MTSAHLNQEQIAGLVCGEGSPTAAHLGECAACAVQVERGRQLLREFGAAVVKSAARTDPEWLRQRNRILAAARAEERKTATWRWATAGALLLITAVTLLLAAPHRVAPATPAVAVRPAAALDANAVLSAVAEELGQDSPQALAPANLFVEASQDFSPAGIHGRAGNRQGERND